MASISSKSRLDKQSRPKFNRRKLKRGTSSFHGSKHKYSFKTPSHSTNSRRRKTAKVSKLRNEAHGLQRTKHRLRLMKIARRLTRKDVQCLLFVAGGIIPKEVAKKVCSGLELFQQLEWCESLWLDKHSQLKEWLQCIGRQDLASKLLGLQHGASDNSTPVETHRFLLLKISNHLSTDEIQQLLFLCPSIPEASSEEIKEGYKLFCELENQEVLGPHNYGYLVQRLEHIGRIDLAKLLVVETGVPDVPSSLKGPNQTLDHIFYVKQTQYIFYRNELSRLTANDHEWRVMIKTTWEDMKHIFAMDTPIVHQWPCFHDQIDTETAKIDPRLISLTLQSISTFAAGYHAHIQTRAESKSFDVDALKPHVEECLDSFTQFNKVLMPTRWNVSSRRRIQERQAERKDPVGTPANNACRCVTDICSGLMDSHQLNNIIAEVGCKLRTIESVTYSAWAYVPMLQWLAMLVHMVRFCRLDITKYLHDLVSVIDTHKNHISQSYGMLTEILGKEVMKTVDPLLNNMPFQASQLSPPNTTSYNHPNTILTPFYTFMISLFAQANGYPIDYPEVGKKLIEILFSDKIYNCQTHYSIDAVRKMAQAMSAEVETLKQSVEKACSSFAQRAIIEKLFNPS